MQLRHKRRTERRMKRGKNSHRTSLASLSLIYVNVCWCFLEQVLISSGTIRNFFLSTISHLSWWMKAAVEWHENKHLMKFFHIFILFSNKFLHNFINKQKKSLQKWQQRPHRTFSFQHQQELENNKQIETVQKAIEKRFEEVLEMCE